VTHVAACWFVDGRVQGLSRGKLLDVMLDSTSALYVSASMRVSASARVLRPGYTCTSLGFARGNRPPAGSSVVVCRSLSSLTTCGQIGGERSFLAAALDGRRAIMKQPTAPPSSTYPRYPRCPRSKQLLRSRSVCASFLPGADSYPQEEVV
jgi:hypothetical protein